MITHLDFSELKEIDDPGYGLQSLIGAIGRKLGFKVEGGGRGPDKGRDLFFVGTPELIHGLTMPLKILVSCKDKSESGKQLRVNDIEGWQGRVLEHGCNAFLLATTVPPTDDLITHVRDVAAKSQPKFPSTVWQPSDIKDILLDQQDGLFRFTIARYFPNSSRKGDSNQHSFDFFVESLERLESSDALELSLEFINGIEDPLLVWETLEKMMGLSNIDLENDLQKHFIAALKFNNDELRDAISDALNEPLQDWISSEEGWDELEVQQIEVTEEDDINFTVIATVLDYRMGEEITLGMNAVIRWTQDGFSIFSSKSDLEAAEEMDHEIEAEMRAEHDL